MPNDLNIESLSIDITASAAAANQELDKLTGSLEKLKGATKGGLSGAKKAANDLKNISTALAALSSVDGAKINSAADALGKLASLPKISDFSKTAKSLTELSRAASGLSGVDIGAFSSQISKAAESLQPLSALGKTNLGSFVNSLKRLPEASNSLGKLDMGNFSSQIKTLSRAVSPLTSQMQSLAGAFSVLPAPVQQSINALSKYNDKADSAKNNTSGLSKSMKTLNFAAIFTMARRVGGEMSGWLDSSNAYVENLNLFRVAMGEAADSAFDFAEEVNAVMGIDVSQWIKYQGTFKQIASGFGVVTDKANLMSQNLTQLGYDISSYFNMSVDDAMTKLESGIAGELEPLRRVGYALDQATLQQVAYNHGIEQSFTSMTQAQKAQIRYVAIMEQSKNVMNDMSRTLESPANQMRILDARIDQLTRSLGNALMPAVSALLPYITAGVQILGEFIDGIAEFFGFEIPKFDYGDLVSKNNEDVEASFGDATKAAEKFKGTLSSIDQLNIIGSKSGGSGEEVGSLYDLDIDLPTYDFLDGLKEQTSEAYNALKGFIDDALPWIEAFGTALLGWKIGSGIISGVSSLTGAFNNLKGAFGDGKAKEYSKTIAGIGGGLAAGASSGILLFNSVKNLVKGTGNLSNNFAMLAGGIGIAGAAIAAFVKLGNPVGAVITGIGALAGVGLGIASAMKEMNREIADTIMYADRGGISIGDLSNGFSSLFDEISGQNDEVIEITRAFEDNQQKAADAAGKIDYLAGKYSELGGTITEEDAQKIANNIETIGNSISTNLGDATAHFVSQLKGNFHDFATSLGIDVKDMSAKFYLLEYMGNETLAQNMQRADELTAKFDRGEGTSEDLAELQKVIDGMGVVDTGSIETKTFELALSQMSNASIDFDDKDAVVNSIADISEKAKKAKESIENSMANQIKMLDDYKATYENMIDPETGLSVAQKFDMQFGDGTFEKLFSDTKTDLELGYESQIKQIEDYLGVYLGMVQSQLNSNIDEATRKIYPEYDSIIKAGRIGGNIRFYDYAQDLRNGVKNEYSKIFEGIGDAESAFGIKASDFEPVGKTLVEGMNNGVIKDVDSLKQTIKGSLDGTEIDVSIKPTAPITLEDYLFSGTGIDTGITPGFDPTAPIMGTYVPGKGWAASTTATSGTTTISENQKDYRAVQANSGEPVFSPNIDVKVQVGDEDVASVVSTKMRDQIYAANGR